MRQADLARCLLQPTLEIFDCFFSVNFTIRLDDQVGLHRYDHEVNVLLVSIVPELVITSVANAHIANTF